MPPRPTNGSSSTPGRERWSCPRIGGSGKWVRRAGRWAYGRRPWRAGSPVEAGGYPPNIEGLMTPSVIVIGGGFGGLAVARGLQDRARVTLVSDQNFLLFTPMLAEVAAGDLDPRHISTPIRQLASSARVVAGSVEAVDPATRTVRVARGFGLDPIELSADAIVLAMGSVPATFGVEGVDEWALSFKSIGDALRIRNRILGLLESATE